MTRGLAGILFLLGACGFEHGHGPSPGDDTGSGSQTDTDQDTDQDGVADLVDNCPAVGNADQRDHDDDTRGDVCDPCPHLVDTWHDADGDGVGDACDPHPDAPGDRLAYFEGFYGPGGPGGPVGWKAVIGADTWQVVDGTIRQSHTDTAYQLMRDDTPNLHDVFVDARIRVNAVTNNVASRRSTSVILAYDDPDHYLFCGLAAHLLGADLNAGEVYTDFFGSSQLDYRAAGFDTQMGDWVTLQARVRDNGDDTTTVTCTSRRGQASAMTTFTTDASPIGDVGVRTNGSDASFDYVFVVEVPAGSS